MFYANLFSVELLWYFFNPPACWQSLPHIQGIFLSSLSLFSHVLCRRRGEWPSDGRKRVSRMNKTSCLPSVAEVRGGWKGLNKWTVISHRRMQQFATPRCSVSLVNLTRFNPCLSRDEDVSGGGLSLSLTWLACCMGGVRGRMRLALNKQRLWRDDGG